MQNIECNEKTDKKTIDIDRYLNILEKELNSSDPTVQNSQGVIITMAINKALLESSLTTEK